MLNPYAQIAAARIQRIIDTEYQYENVSDIIADIMHYCEHGEKAFSEALALGEKYYAADHEEIENGQEH